MTAFWEQYMRKETDINTENKEQGGASVHFPLESKTLWHLWDKLFYCVQEYWKTLSDFGPNQFAVTDEKSFLQINYDRSMSYPKTQLGEILCCTNHAIWFSAKNGRLFISYTMASQRRLLLITAHINQDFILTLCFHQTKTHF